MTDDITLALLMVVSRTLLVFGISLILLGMGQLLYRRWSDR